MIRADYEPENQSLNSGTQYSVAQVSVYFYDDATVFGIAGTEETIVRYDLPARGITEGWTVSAVVDQTEAMAEENWPDICVAIFADDADVYDDFARVLTQHGARFSQVIWMNQQRALQVRMQNTTQNLQIRIQGH